jgi:sphinganine-1-phosphate aldolase
MDFMKLAIRLSRLNPRLAAWLERRLTSIPQVQGKIEEQYDDLMHDLEASVKPYRADFASFPRLPTAGRPRDEILAEMEALCKIERPRWQDGYASGAVYHGDAEHIEFLNRVYALNSQSNPLHSDLWPSAAKYEAEIVSMVAHLLGAEATADETCGTLSSGGTESILLAMKAYRDRARERRSITQPEMIVPVTAHAAFEKAAQYFNIKPIRIPVDQSYRADVEAARRAISRNTIVIVGSAPSFPHGMIDPIEALSDLARQ